MSTVPSHPGRVGMSLLELVMSLAILGTVLVLATEGLATGVSTAAVIENQSTRLADASRVLNEMATQLRGADPEYIYETNALGQRVFSYRTSGPIDPQEIIAAIDNEGSWSIRYDTEYVYIYDPAEGSLSRSVSERQADGSFVIVEPMAVMLRGLDGPDAFRLDDTVGGGGATLLGSRLRLRLALTGQRVDGSPVETVAHRTVFIRSSLYNGSLARADFRGQPPPGGDQQDDEALLPDPDEEDEEELAAPTMAFTNMSMARGNSGNVDVHVVVDINAPSGSTILGDLVEVALVGDDLSWNYDFDADRVTVTGSTRGSYGVQVTATAQRDGQTRSATDERYY